MSNISSEKPWVNEFVGEFEMNLNLAYAGKLNAYDDLEKSIIKAFNRASEEFGKGEEWKLMEPLDDLITGIMNDSSNNQSVGANPIMDPKLMELIVSVSRKTDWYMWEFYAALNPSTPINLLEELSESTFSWEENSTKEAVANNPSSPTHIKKKLSNFINSDKTIINKVPTKTVNLKSEKKGLSSDTKGYESQVLDFAEVITTAMTLIDENLTDFKSDDLILLCDLYSEFLRKEIEEPKFGSYVWLPQLYKLPMDQNRENFEINTDVHLIENFSKKILIKSEDPDFGDTTKYENSDFWRIVLFRTGEKIQYDQNEDLGLLISQIEKASQVFELPKNHFSAAIKWVRLGEVETVIENKKQLPK